MRYTIDQLNDIKTIHASQFDDLKFDNGMRRVWLSRLTVADGAPYPNMVTVELLIDGCWVATEEYEG